jgi:tetratricopeptide (TPR) repeat protein
MSSQPIELFYSYSHNDEELRKELDKHLKLLKRQEIISGWNDRDIEAGEEWAGQISEHLEAAGIILLLVSADFIASDYCYDIELKRAIERHKAKEARVIPIILRPCDWQTTSFAKLQALPQNGHPVTSWQNRDEAFLDIATGIRKVAESLTSKSIAILQSQRDKTTADTNKHNDLPPVWNVPHDRNANFTGREDLLNELKASLNSSGAAALTQPQAIHGLGGIGKTQLAVEYAYRHGSEYNIVWWVRSEEAITIASDYASLAAKLDLVEKEVPDQSVIIEAVKEWLRRNKNWLLIFDNAPDANSLRNYMPKGGAGHVLITSRFPNWRGIASPLTVKALPLDKATEFLINRTEQLDEAAAGELAEKLGGLPLALEQAGAYIEASDCTLYDYINMFQANQQKALERGKPSTDYPGTLFTTWNISFQQVDSESKAAADLMKLCAFFAPDDIPLQIIREGTKHLLEPLATVAADQFLLNDALVALRKYSLIERSDDTISIHRLVQSVTIFQMDENTKNGWIESAVRMVNSAFPYESPDVRTWDECSRLLPHALTAASFAEADKLASKETGRLLNQAGAYLLGRAEFLQAKDLYERALAIDEAAFGPNHPDVAIDVNNLSLVLRELGDLAGARANLERSLAISEVALGPNHLDIAIRLSNLGVVLQELGDLAGARANLERALPIDEEALGINHPDVAIDVNNLGIVLELLGELTGAKANYERALAISETAFGPNHPTVAIRLNNLGLVLKELGDLAGARANIERALKIFQQYLGQEHPSTIRVSNNLRILEDEINEANQKEEAPEAT